MSRREQPKSSSPPGTTAILLGFWASVFATVLVISSGITATIAVKIPSLISGLLLVPAFVVLMVCIHDYAPAGRKTFSRLGVLFALGYAVLISFNYYMQLTLVAQGLYSDAFAMDDPHSVMWVIEVLGYGFMGLSSLAAGWVFTGGILQKAVRWLFVTNGVLGIGGVVGFALRWDMNLLLGGLVAWDVVMPASTILIALVFRSRCSRGDAKCAAL
jgi:hypothetical protein